MRVKRFAWPHKSSVMQCRRRALRTGSKPATSASPSQMLRSMLSSRCGVTSHPYFGLPNLNDLLSVRQFRTCHSCPLPGCSVLCAACRQCQPPCSWSAALESRAMTVTTSSYLAIVRLLLCCTVPLFLCSIVIPICRRCPCRRRTISASARGRCGGGWSSTWSRSCRGSSWRGSCWTAAPSPSM